MIRLGHRFALKCIDFMYCKCLQMLMICTNLVPLVSYTNFAFFNTILLRKENKQSNCNCCGSLVCYLKVAICKHVSWSCFL